MVNQYVILISVKSIPKGWNWTWQVPRAEFDKTLTDALEAKGVDIAFEKEVVAVTFEGSISTTTIKDLSGNLSMITAKIYY